MGILLALKVERDTSGPDYAPMGRQARPGYGQAAHIHRLEDETLLLLEEEVSAFCGDRQ
jgi:hypothetical protein